MKVPSGAAQLLLNFRPQSAGFRPLHGLDGGAGLKVEFACGSKYEFAAELLRVMSPSAEVQGHSPEQRVTVGNKRNVKIKELRPVGTYAIRIAFNDGHDTGLYTWTYLQQLGREKEKRWGEYLEELGKKGLSRG